MRLELQIPDDLAADLARFKPRTLSLPMFCAYLLELGIDRDTRLSAYHVGAGDTGNLTTEQIQPTPASEGISGLQAVEVSAPDSKNSFLPLIVQGVGVGRESEGGGRKGGKSDRSIPENLEPYAELIHDFWRVKGGSKGDRAWNLLIGQLTKIQKLYGNETLESQIELAVNGKWKGITVANLERFRQPDKKGGKEPEHRHPASRVFTADRGFDDGPTTNPLMADLF
jgi:hypothetical protein